MQGGERALKYSTEEAMTEIRYRRERITVRRNRRQQIALSVTTGILSIVLLGAIAVLSGGTPVNREKTFYGALMAGKESGGYVLVALIAFVLGITVTFLCLRYRKRNPEHREDGNNEGGD